MTRNNHALRTSFDESVATSPALEACDMALISAGRVLADRIDTAVAEAEGQELTKTLYLLPHLINVLRELLATPQSRANVAAKGAQGAPVQDALSEPVSKLSQLRSVQERKRTG